MRHFGVEFFDVDTGRGVPLVEIKTTNNTRFVSDSAGWIAIDAAEFGTESVFFWIESHGYELDRKGAGEVEGRTFQLVPGDRRRVALKRTNIAERLYRITGEGIYHHSRKLDTVDEHVSHNNTRGGVFGQDSVVTALYDDQLYWFWGDTRRANGHLGNFKVSGATSPSPLINDVEPDIDIDLQYFVGRNGFVRQMCPFKGPGAIWIGGLSVIEHAGDESMFCSYVRIKNLVEKLERGIAEWDDKKQVFVKRRIIPLDAPLAPMGDPLKLVVDGQNWFYYGRLFRNIRVRATKHHLLDLSSYEGYTCLQPGTRWDPESPPLERDSEGNLVWGWKKDTGVVDFKNWEKMAQMGLVKSEDNPFVLKDIESGARVVPAGGSIAPIEQGKKWALVTTQAAGSSVLGEVWYAVAKSPMGPWSKARKIVSHDKYSFYNVKQHPYFASSSFIYFEGTYTASFSGNTYPTPRYDYNQIMYRLDLQDPRLPKVGP